MPKPAVKVKIDYREEGHRSTTIQQVNMEEHDNNYPQAMGNAIYMALTGLGQGLDIPALAVALEQFTWETASLRECEMKLVNAAVEFLAEWRKNS